MFILSDRAEVVTLFKSEFRSLNNYIWDFENGRMIDMKIIEI